MSEINTRVPEVFGTRASISIGDGVYAWELDTDGDLRLTGDAGLSAGQGWEYDVDDDAKPTGTTITDDPYWVEDVDGDLKPT
tara:strand:- start:24247 stop:24492 length:246 start_codon:yes stop_codon:yes gene_type:complete